MNGKKVNIASYTVKPGDEVEVRERTSSKQLGTRGVEENQYRTVPAWLSMTNDALKGAVTRLPAKEEMPADINVQLIVEFYSR